MSIRFAGYAALFNRVDRGGDVIRQGAFVHATAPLPIFWQHDARRPIGMVETLGEDARGLRIVGRVGDDVPVRAGAGLSFGYRVKRGREGHPRELNELELVEVSLVRQPMQPLARVLAVERTRVATNGRPGSDASGPGESNGGLAPAHAGTDRPEAEDQQ